MARPAAVWTVLAATSIGLGACATDVDNPVPSTPDSRATTSTAAVAVAPTTTTTIGVLQAPPGQPPTDPTDPTAQQAAQRLIDAWLANDLTSAVAIAGSDISNALFAEPAPTQATAQPCRGSETEVGATECDYTYAAGVVTLVVTGNAGNGYRVTNVGVIPT